MALAPRQPISHGRPYRYYLNGPVHMMTVRKRVGPSPTHHLAMIHSVDYSSSDHLASDDSSGDSSSSSSSSSSSETSSDPSSDDLPDSSSDHSLPAPSSSMRPSHHLCLLVPSIPYLFAAIIDRPSHDSSSTSPSRKRSRSHVASIPLSSPIPGPLSYARIDLLPSTKGIRSSEFATELEVSSEDSFEPYIPRETDLEIDVDVVRSDGIEIDLEIQEDIDKCIAYANALRDRGIDARVVVEAVDREEIEMGARGPEEEVVVVTYETLGDLVQRFHDHTVKIPAHRVQAIEELKFTMTNGVCLLPGKVEKGRANAMEVVEWAGMEESKALRKSGQMHQNFEKSSLAMTRKLDDMIEFPKSQSKRTYKKDLECEVVMVKMPKCMSRLTYDQPIGNLDMMEDKVDNLSPQSTLQIPPSFEVYTSPVTYPKEVYETIGILIEVEPLEHIKLEDLGFNTCSHNIFPNSKEFLSVDEPEPQPLPNLPFLHVNIGDKRGTNTHINPYGLGSF
nr:hypothetical protein [Tanacetum cinerariifolium]